MRATILGHRDIVRLSIGRIPLGPKALRYADRVLAHPARRRAARRAGGDRRSQLLISIVLGFTIDETGEAASRPPTAAADVAAAMTRDYLASLPGRPRSRTSSRPPSTMPGADPDERFELLLDLFVDGLASPRRRR